MDESQIDKFAKLLLVNLVTVKYTSITDMLVDKKVANHPMTGLFAILACKQNLMEKKVIYNCESFN